MKNSGGGGMGGHPGGQSSGFSKYENFDNHNKFNGGGPGNGGGNGAFGGSKDSTAYTNSNYRKPFNPSNM